MPHFSPIADESSTSKPDKPQGVEELPSPQGARKKKSAVLHLVFIPRNSADGRLLLASRSWPTATLKSFKDANALHLFSIAPYPQACGRGQAGSFERKYKHDTPFRRGKLSREPNHNFPSCQSRDPRPLPKYAGLPKGGLIKTGEHPLIRPLFVSHARPPGRPTHARQPPRLHARPSAHSTRHTSKYHERLIGRANKGSRPHLYVAQQGRGRYRRKKIAGWQARSRLSGSLLFPPVQDYRDRSCFHRYTAGRPSSASCTFLFVPLEFITVRCASRWTSAFFIFSA